jgi:enhancing lycopene biosynthesis protein 2
MKNIAVILSGCGFLDGAEIRESVLTLLALDDSNIKNKVEIFAPNIEQHHTVNHLNQEESSSNRNVLEESARIARGEIKDLATADASKFDAVILPGGFGVAKNLSDFAFKGSNGVMNKETSDFLLRMYENKKPIGAICISPAVITLALGDKGINVTIGNDEGTATELEKTGAKHHNTDVTEFHIDQKNKIVSTAAYMYGDARIADVYKGISGCVNTVLEMA